MAKLSSAELAKREDIIKTMKKNKRGLVKRYGSDAEKVMYGRATNIAKKVTETQMEQSNLKELVRAALMQEKAGFSKEFDSDPALKGGQKNLPDGLQKAIIKKEKGVKEDQRIYLFDPDKSDKGTTIGKGDPTIQKIKGVYSQILDNHRALVNLITKTYPEVIKDQKVVKYFNGINTELKILKDIWQSEIKEDLEKRALFNPQSGFGSFADKVSVDLSKNPDTTEKLGRIVAQILEVFPLLMKQIQVVSPDIFKDKKSLDYANALAKPLKELNILLKDLRQSKIKEDLDLGHEDDEPHMLKSDLYHIGKYAMNLYQMVDQFEGKGEVDFPHWWQSKIIKAKEMMSSAKHYLDFELREPEIDAAVDVIDASDALNSTGMEINEKKTETLAGKIAKQLKSR